MRKQTSKTRNRKKCVELAKKIVRDMTPRCAYCGKGRPEVAIHAHHIYNEGCHPSMSADLDNLITVCFTHHISNWNSTQPSFHKNPMEMADWFKENFPERYQALKLRSRESPQIDWGKKYNELKEIYDQIEYP